MKRALFVILCLGLAACGTPQQQCIAAATRDQRVLDRLIAETERNIARGYAIQQVTMSRPVVVDCTPRPTAANPNPVPRTCLREGSYTVNRPQAIDLNAERAKLASMVAKRRDLARQAEAAIAQCRATYPE